MRFLIPLCIVALGCVAEPASAQGRWGPDQIPYCGSETSGEACRQESLNLLLSKLQLPPAETLAIEGYAGIRVFQYDAFGNIWPATLIQTRPVSDYRREGMVQAVTIHADGRVISLERPIWENGWREMDGIMQMILEQPPVDLSAPAIPTSGPPGLSSCVDPPTIIIELVTDGRVHRWWPNSCQRDAAVAQSRRVAEIIAAAFPVCGHFAIDLYGRGLGRVRACLTAEGDDPFAAAEVMEIIRPDVSGDARVIYDPTHLSEGVTLVGLDGRRAAGRGEVLAALKDGALGANWLRVLRAAGDADGVTVIGQLKPLGDAAGRDPQVIRIRWAKETDGVWRITDWAPEI